MRKQINPRTDPNGIEGGIGGKNGNMGYKLTDHIGYTPDRLERVFLPGKIRRFSLGPRGLATTTPLAGQSLAGPRNRFPPASPGGREGGSPPWGI